MPVAPSVPDALIKPTKLKLEAEAEAARTDSLANEALARKLDAEAKHLLAQTRKETLQTQAGQIAFDREKVKRDHELAANEHHLFYPFTGEVSSQSVQACIDSLTYWMRTQPDDSAIEIQFNSPGGSIVPGFALWDFIQGVRLKGHPVTTSSIGMAASMGGILLQAGDTRVMGRQSWLMIHEASFSAGGKIGEVEDTVDWVKMVQERILTIFADRSHMEVEDLRAKWERKNWWISSEQALELGLVDEIR